jgi:branched-chain amino acid transport system substrate-binding protein
MFKLAITAAALSVLLGLPAQAEMNGATRIGVLNDMSSVYSDFQGPGSVVAAQMAAEEFAKGSKRRVEILSADHQNKPDIGGEIARRWFDVEGVDMIIDVPNSAVALAVADIARDKNKVFIASGGGTALLTGAKCSPNTVHWTYDTWSMGHGVSRGLLHQGGKTWFFVTADYAFGEDLQKQASDEVAAEGGQVLGSVRHPIGTGDFSSFLLQAQASRAQVIGLANAGGDTVNSIKQAGEFNLAAQQKIVALIFDLQSVPALGLKTAQGITALNAFYWDLNDQTRAWSKKYQERHPNRRRTAAPSSPR